MATSAETDLVVGPYTMNLVATSTPTGLVATFTIEGTFDFIEADSRTPSNVIVWVDGYAVVSMFIPQPPHTIAATVVSARIFRYDIVVDGSKLKNKKPGPRKLTVHPIDHAAIGVTIAHVSVEVDASTGPTVPGAVGRVIPRTLFHLHPDEITATPGMLADVQAAGINCLWMQVFLSGRSSLQAFRDEWLAPLEADLAWCTANGFIVYGVADELCRTPTERAWINNTAWAVDAVRETAALCAEYGVWGIDVVDEIAGLPDDDPSYRKIVKWWREAGGPSLGWPPAAGAPRILYDEWEDPSMATHVSRYWSNSDLEFRQGRPGATWTIGTAVEGIQRAASRRPAHTPSSCLISAMGAYYNKRVAGGDYQTGDEILTGAVPPEIVIAQIFFALGSGFDALRTYGYDFPLWQVGRLNGAIPSDGHQTGTKPGDVRWSQGLTPAFNAVADHEAAMLAGPARPVRFDGPWAYCGRGTCQWAINVTERAVTDTPTGYEAVGQSEIITTAGTATYVPGQSVPIGGVIIRS